MIELLSIIKYMYRENTSKMRRYHKHVIKVIIICYINYGFPNPNCYFITYNIIKSL